eukprot:CAMPEP_0184868712 /NCGR_PEP_ID=MMETSP0580-20130426/31492_1 /TAXON_ID=1118495 /ORGANISM="Dactyliosolen fragilissimus" /LENGTH=85 /DNA_ID=CAMNT_0027369777 /DNA_START=147 /DNA_END=404 /DNA_ORIENTATION=+
MTIGGNFSKKEKVEEDIFIRQKEHDAYLKRKETEEASKPKLTAEELAAKAAQDEAISEVFGVLSMTKETLSDKAVENIASWKLGN